MLSAITPPPPLPTDSLNLSVPAPVSDSIPPQNYHDAAPPSLLSSAELQPAESEMTDRMDFDDYKKCRHTSFESLPIEIHEAVLDYLFGARGSAVASVSSKVGVSSWSKALRHPRRKVLSDLALVSPKWRPLVQERIYRHIQIKGTIEALRECSDWFTSHPYLAIHVRHIEFLVPVWGDRVRKLNPLPQPRREINEDNSLADMAAVLHATASDLDNTGGNCSANGAFRFAHGNASLQQIFSHVAFLFPGARILTLESVHCKKPPMIGHFDSDPWGQTGQQRFEVLPNIQCFVMKGAWNIMRDYQHWCNLSQAMPNMREWQCSYAKPKAGARTTIARILNTMPKSLTRLNISLDGLCRKTGSYSRMFGTGQSEQEHLCLLLGEVAPQLESLTFTGKGCARLFASIRHAFRKSATNSRLKSIDLVLTSCCREQQADDGSIIINELSGVTNMYFIEAFERMVVSAVRSLDVLTALDYMRIRFIDLDSAYGLLHPYFQLVGNQCIGLWSEGILETMSETRPNTHYEELSDGILPRYGITAQAGTRTYPRTIPRSIKASTYEIIADKSKS